MRPITEGEEICISYVELTGTHAERRAALQAGYHFDVGHQARHVLNLTSRHHVVSTACCDQHSMTIGLFTSKP